MRNFDGLVIIADRGIEKAASINKSAKELMGRLTTGNMALDMGLGFVPGVGTAMSAYDTVRNGVNGVNDLFHGRFKSALGNFGSAAFNAGVTGLNAMTFGVGGKAVGAIGKLLGRGAKMLGRGAQAAGMARTAKGLGTFAKNVGRVAGKGLALDARVAGAVGNRLAGSAGKALASARVYNPAMKAMPGMGGGVGGWIARHPIMATVAGEQLIGSPLAGMTEGAQGNQADVDRNTGAAVAGGAGNMMRDGMQQWGAGRRSFVGANGAVNAGGMAPRY